MNRTIGAIIISVRVAAAMALTLAVSACSGTSTNSSPGTSAASSATAAHATTAGQQVDSQLRNHSEVEFAAANFAVAQNAGSASVTVTRVGSAKAAISVDYATVAGTAVAGTDFTSDSGTLNWAENDSTSKMISVPISNVTPFLDSKSFEVLLSNPSASARIASPGGATVTISGDAVVALGTLSLAASAYTVAQSAGSFMVTVNRTAGSSGSISVAYATTNGSAVAGTDFTAATGTLDWADGDAAPKTFTVTVSNAVASSESKTFAIALSNPAGGATLGSPSSAIVTINGDAAAPMGTLQLSASSTSVSQSAGTVLMSATRTGGSAGAVSVGYATSNGTAVAGTNFVQANGTLQWADGDATPKSFSVAILNATPFSGSKTFTVALSSPSPGATIANPGMATTTINGDAAAPAGSAQLSAPNYAIAQGAGALTVTVDRTGGSNGAVGVMYGTSNGTAVAGTDFTATSGTIQWANGDATPKTFTVAISNAVPFTGSKSFTLTLSSPSGGATLSTPSSASVAITGDAAAAVGSLQLSASSGTVAQTAGTLTETVNRTGGSSGAVSVTYATANGTAVAGTDFTAANGTLIWSDGDAASKTFSVPISNAAPFSGSKTFSVALSGPTGGATLSSPSSDTVTINGSGSTSTSWQGRLSGKPHIFAIDYIQPNQLTSGQGDEPVIAKYPLVITGETYATQTPMKTHLDTVRSLNPNIVMIGYLMLLEDALPVSSGPGYDAMRYLETIESAYLHDINGHRLYVPGESGVAYFDPSSTDVRSAVLAAVKAVLTAYPFDGIFLDNYDVQDAMVLDTAGYQYLGTSGQVWDPTNYAAKLAAMTSMATMIRGAFPTILIEANGDNAFPPFNGELVEGQISRVASQAAAIPGRVVPFMPLFLDQVSGPTDTLIATDMAEVQALGAWYGASVTYQQVIWPAAFGP